MNPSVELTAEQSCEIVRQELQLTYESLLPRDVVVDHEDQDSELLYCLQRVIEYYSSPQQYEDWHESLSPKDP